MKQSYFYEKINKIDKPLENSPKEKERRTLTKLEIKGGILQGIPLKSRE
jgi:hypothetical protein